MVNQILVVVIYILHSCQVKDHLIVKYRIEIRWVIYFRRKK